MTSFLAIAHYSPVLVLTIGLFTFAGFWGVGTLLLRAIRVPLFSPWRELAAILAGIETVSLAVQILGMLGLATHAALIGLWWAAVGCAAAAASMLRPRKWPVAFARQDWPALLPLAIIAVALAVNLAIAVAPSTKIDETYYHMLVPSRIVTDGALHFYREPWIAAIWPQMIFQIASAPVHAMGYPDAMNVVSWGIAATLLWFAWEIMRAADVQPPAWRLVVAAGLCVGLYPAVWDVTGGAHAMGDLAMAAAVVGICGRERLLGSLPAPAFALLESILIVAAATTKIVVMPLCGLLLCFVAWRLWRSEPGRTFFKAIAALAAPWLVFYCPIALWCWAVSGSPFGPILSGDFGKSAYPSGWSGQAFALMRLQSQLPILRNLEITLIDYSPLIWLGVVGAFFMTTLSLATRLALIALFVLQAGVIYWWLPHEARYLGGLQYGLLIVFAAFALPEFSLRLASARVLAAVCAIFLLPWLGAQVYYGSQFFRVSFGLEKMRFYERDVAFYADFVKLDRLLPRDTVILVKGFRLDSVYAPRPVFYDELDLPKDRPVALFAPAGASDKISIPGYAYGASLYEDNHAVVQAYRTPGKPPAIGTLLVMALNRE